MKRAWRGALTIAAIGVAVFALQAQASSPCQNDEPFCFRASAEETPKLIERVSLPEIAVPIWMGSGE